MDYILIIIYSIITILVFTKKKEYVLSVILVGQPILKLMVKPFSQIVGTNIALVYYISIGLLALFIANVIKSKGMYIKKSIIRKVGVSVLLGVFMAMYLLISPSKEYGFNKLIDYFTTIVLIVLLSALFLKNIKDFKNLLSAITNITVLIGIITIGVIYFKTGGIVARIGTTLGQEIEIYGINFALSIWFGRRMGLGLLSAWYDHKIKPTKIKKIKILTLILLVSLSISRGPILSVVISFFVIFIIGIRKKISSAKFLRYAIVVAISSGIFILFFVKFAEFEKFSRLISLDDGNAQGRLYMYKTSLKFFLDNPLGIGLGGFESIGGIFKYPHNIFLEIMIELGVIGTAIFIMLVCKAFRDYIYVKKNVSSNEVLAMSEYALVIYIFALTNAQFSGDITSNEYIGFGMVLLSILCDMSVNQQNIEPTSVRYRE